MPRLLRLLLLLLAAFSNWFAGCAPDHSGSGTHSRIEPSASAAPAGKSVTESDRDARSNVTQSTEPTSPGSDSSSSGTSPRPELDNSIESAGLVSSADPAGPSAAAPDDRPKTFKGRVIAPVMSYQGGADWLERSDRDATEQPDKVIEALEIAPGSTVADIGAGTGYFSLRIAKRIGPKGRVLATEIQPEMLQRLGASMKKEGVANIDLIQCTATDAKLPTGKVDLALMVDVYHELSDPEATMAQVRRSLKPDGRLVLVEYRGEDPTVPIREEHKMTLRQVRYEIEPMGFRLRQVFEFLVHQHVIVFVKDDVRGEEPVINPTEMPMVRIPGGELPTADQFRAAGFEPLSDGKDLDGWNGDPGLWSVRDRLIIGSDPEGDTANRYLCSKEEFDDFELDIQWRLADLRNGNSGVQFRSQPQPDGRVAGFQAEIAARHHGGVFEELGRGWVQHSSDTPNAVIVDGWNRFTIRCQGNRFVIAVNGVKTAQFSDDKGRAKGVIALQHYRGDVEFREIWIKRLASERLKPR